MKKGCSFSIGDNVALTAQGDEHFRKVTQDTVSTFFSKPIYDLLCGETDSLTIAGVLPGPMEKSFSLLFNGYHTTPISEEFFVKIN